MGRRKRRTMTRVRRPVRRSVFFRCPRCQHNSVVVELDRKGGFALIRCFNCQLTDTVEISSTDERVDAYAKFFDKYVGEG